MSCLPCDAGTFQSTPGATSCMQCNAGSFQSAPGAMSCDACPIGTAQAAPGSTACTGCMTGTFAAMLGASTCNACTPTCPPGQFETAACTASSDTGCAACDSSCATCSGAGATECTSCATGDAPVAGVCQPGCTAAPSAGCKLPLLSGKSKLTIKDNAVDTKDVLKWKWVKGAATTLAELGNPTATDGYLLCLYDAGSKLATISLPPGDVCAGKPCWLAKKTGYKYKDKELTPNGALAATLKAGTAGKASAKVNGKGANLPALNPTGFTGPIDVQLQRTDHAICFGTTFSAPFKKNVGGIFSDNAD